MRIFAVSDLHADFRENRRLLDSVSAVDHQGDALIVAGDVGTSLAVVTETLGFLRGRFREVFFVPGNHELWVREGDGDSLRKFSAVLAACEAVGVRTRPARVGGAWVVPLFSWYHASFDVHDEAVTEELEGWTDHYLCRWPEGVERVDRLFLAMNEPHLREYDAPVVSFSHFVPRPDLVPRVEWLRFKGLARVAGTEELEAQVRRLGSAVHVFGHTHIAEDRAIDGVRYVQNYLKAPAPGATPAPLFSAVWPPDGGGSVLG
ncbi:MAG TPA: metallophosphoesterase [Longimicrobium sp.]|nr:metallophosphoesterase [Longimicrobium sp.]